jgi:hypothetical protein
VVLEDLDLVAVRVLDERGRHGPALEASRRRAALAE